MLTSIVLKSGGKNVWCYINNWSYIMYTFSGNKMTHSEKSPRYLYMSYIHRTKIPVQPGLNFTDDILEWTHNKSLVIGYSSLKLRKAIWYKDPWGESQTMLCIIISVTRNLYHKIASLHINRIILFETTFLQLIQILYFFLNLTRIILQVNA